MPVADIKEGGSWIRSAVYTATELVTPADDHWHQLDLEVEWSGIDWECYLASKGAVIWSSAQLWEEEAYGVCVPAAKPPAAAFISRLRRHEWPWMTQITAGYAAFHGLLEDEEAKVILKACLPDAYPFPFAKRMTPIFAVIDDAPATPKRILPCNVPYRWILHIGRCVSVYFDKSQPEATCLIILNFSCAGLPSRFSRSVKGISVF